MAPFGFSTGTPWLPRPGAWKALTVEKQTGDQASMLELYRDALRSRRAFRDEPFAWLPSPPGVLAIARGDHVCVINLSGSPVSLAPAEVVLASHPLAGDVLPPDAAAWLRRADSEGLDSTLCE